MLRRQGQSAPMWRDKGLPEDRSVISESKFFGENGEDDGDGENEMVLEREEVNIFVFACNIDVPKFVEAGEDPSIFVCRSACAVPGATQGHFKSCRQ